MLKLPRRTFLHLAASAAVLPAVPLAEFICAENNQILFDYHMPVADKPDF